MTTFKCILKDGTTRTIFVKDSHFGMRGASLSVCPPCFCGQAVQIRDVRDEVEPPVLHLVPDPDGDDEDG